MMTIYAKPMPSGEVESFVDEPESPGPGFVLVTSGWPLPARQNDCVRPFITDGAVRWDDPRTLDEIKAAKNAEINAARLSANMTSFPYAGKGIACDTLSRSDIDGTNGYVTLNGALPPGWGGAWKAIDNTYVPIATVDDWKAFYAAMVSAGTANFNHAQDLKTQLAAATTPEQVAAIVW
jgi:hypothetical protein